MKKKILINEAYLPLLETKKRYVNVFGGSSSGKSYAVHQCLLKKFLDVKGCNILALRKIAESIKISIFVLFWKLLNEWNIGGNVVRVNHSDYTFRNLRNDNMIITGGMKDEKQREKIKSVTALNGPITHILMEEASEFLVDDYRQANIRLRGELPIESIYNGLNKQMIFVYNPIDIGHWLKTDFQLEMDEHGKAYSKRDDTFVIHTTVEDNAFATEEDKEELDKLENVDPYYYNVYRLGQWGSTAKHNVVIPYSLIWKYRKNRVDPVGQFSIGIDPARFGDDKAVIYMKQGLKKIDRRVFEKSDGNMLAEAIEDMIRINRHDDSVRVDVKIDITGIGSSCADILKRKKRSDSSSFWKQVNFYEINFGGKPKAHKSFSEIQPKNKIKYGNVVTEMYFEMCSLIPVIDFGFDSEEERQLITELSNRQYAIDEKTSVYILEPKNKYKERMGHSPDFSDAAALCCYSPGIIVPRFEYLGSGA